MSTSERVVVIVISVAALAACASLQPAPGKPPAFGAAVSAYVLFVNGIVGEDAVMNAQTLPQVKMPNRDGFVSDWPPRARN